MLTRHGTTLAELLVAITLAAMVLATATTSLLRQQRVGASLAAQAALGTQLGPAAATVAAQLAQVSASAGDLAPHQWRDTALQFRAPVATGINCAAGVGMVAFAATSTNTIPLGGVLSAPRAGDTLWLYSDSTGGWSARGIGEVTTTRSPCGGREGDASLRVQLAAADTVAAGTPLRITRQHRLVVYRGSDGSWQLGLREGSVATSELGAPQPVAGPFLAAAPTGERTGFRYFDAAGEEMRDDADLATAARVRRVRLTVVAARRDGRGTRPADAVAVDSMDVALPAARGP